MPAYGKICSRCQGRNHFKAKCRTKIHSAQEDDQQAEFSSDEADPAPRGGHTRAVPPQMTACAPPNENCAPPSEDCAPKKLTGSGLLECKLRPKVVFATRIFVIFVDCHRIS